MDLDSPRQSVTRIVHIITTIMRGGAENQLLILVSEQVKLGLEVHVIFLKGEAELADEFENSGAIVHINFANLPLIHQVTLIRKFLGTPHFEKSVVHGHLPRAQITAAYSITNSQRLICTRHDEDRFFPGANFILSKLVFKTINFRIHQWIAISQSVKLKMVTFGELPRFGDINVVHYGFRSNASKVDSSLSQELKSQYDLTNDNFIIGCVARLVWQKDHVTLLRAFHTHYSRNPKSRLVLIGDGPLRARLTMLAEELEIADAVIFTGKVSTVREHLKILDVFVLPSTTEGFGLVLLEAMEAELPIIASNISALPEVLGECGLLFEMGNSVDLAMKINSLESLESRQPYSRLSRERLKEFTPETMCSRVMRIYEKEARNR